MRVDLAESDDLPARVRAIADESVVVVIDSGWAALPLALALALAQAAIAPLAIERAPAGRLNLVVRGAGADPAAVEAAVAFLEAARSTTGQILAIS
ncbi:MAG TPA: hypothetical protein VF638_15175 [Sphingomonas sp.]|jgi:hypothetical protein